MHLLPKVTCSAFNTNNVRNVLCMYRKEYIELMRSTQKMTEEELKTLADKYDSVYLHPVSLPSVLEL